MDELASSFRVLREEEECLRRKITFWERCRLPLGWIRRRMLDLESKLSKIKKRRAELLTESCVHLPKLFPIPDPCYVTVFTIGSFPSHCYDGFPLLPVDDFFFS
jgi:hypothetical protein|tara:strand:- start:274 stop:585 length:312 start_codon:yes stop_codon:yes gene_type:complete